MPTECIPDLFGFARVEGRAVAAAFDGDTITSDAGALLLGASDRAIGLTARFAGCFRDARCQALVEHRVATLVGQRMVGIALGYPGHAHPQHSALRRGAARHHPEHAHADPATRL